MNGFQLIQKSTPVINPFWSDFSITPPSATQFSEHGMESLAPFARVVTALDPTEMTQKNDILGVGEVGKVFSKTIDLKKYLDIRSIKVEVSL